MVAQAEATHHDLALLVVEFVQPLVEVLQHRLVLQHGGRVQVVLVGNDVEHRPFAIAAHRRVHGGHALGQLEHLLDILERLVEHLGDVLGGGLGLEFLGQLARRPQVGVELLDDMDRQADGAGLVHQAALDGLADPPGGIGGETETALRVEFLDRADQAQVAFLDQVQQREAAIHVATRDLDHQPQVALDHLVTRRRVPLLRLARVEDFLLGGEQGRVLDLAEVHARRVGIGGTARRCLASVGGATALDELAGDLLDFLTDRLDGGIDGGLDGQGIHRLGREVVVFDHALDQAFRWNLLVFEDGWIVGFAHADCSVATHLVVCRGGRYLSGSTGFPFLRIWKCRRATPSRPCPSVAITSPRCTICPSRTRRLRL